jgi:hypothetical protein
MKINRTNDPTNIKIAQLLTAVAVAHSSQTLKSEFSEQKMTSLDLNAFLKSLNY